MLELRTENAHGEHSVDDARPDVGGQHAADELHHLDADEVVLRVLAEEHHHLLDQRRQVGLGQRVPRLVDERDQKLDHSDAHRAHGLLEDLVLARLAVGPRRLAEHSADRWKLLGHGGGDAAGLEDREVCQRRETADGRAGARGVALHRRRNDGAHGPLRDQRGERGVAVGEAGGDGDDGLEEVLHHGVVGRGRQHLQQRVHDLKVAAVPLQILQPLRNKPRVGPR